MGDLQAWPQPDGNLTEEKESAAAGNPLPSSIDGKIWGRAEERTSEIILCVQPTVKSEQKRSEVIYYVQRLIRSHIGCQVFPFGSVPLKTYLPDGDVDLTTFSNFPNVEDKWANDVRIVLEGEEYNNFAEFRVREVQVIRAEVKLVKCLVDNIVVDISFNQLGGLCTLCFLEKVDRLIGKDHLFKRSIILVKAWCYYESRILGAHHGLISTYALETLVLYIFHLFHASLHGPLEVLYRFLDYFSKFDWDNYCVSLLGPVVISTLPDIKVLTTEPPETVGGELLLNEEFLKSCTDLYSVSSKSHDNQRSLTPKYLNIIDPLRENNNLGRSVSKGNFYRIRSAFSYGARKLGKILLSSEERIAEELDKFFLNTLERHGRGQRPDVSDSIECSPVGESTSFLQSSKADAEDNKHDNKVFTHQIKSSKGNGNSTELSESDGLKRISDVSLESRSTIAGAFQVNLCGEIKKNKTALVDSSSKLTGVVSDVVYSPRHSGETKTKQGIKSSCFSNILSNCSCRSDSEMHREENSVYGNCISMDAKDLTNVPSHHDYLRSKSPGVLAEHEISTHCSYCEPSANVKSKAVTGSVLKNTKIYVFCQGHMSIKDRKDWGSHEATVSNHMYCSVPCDHDDHQTASYVENLSISDPVSVGKEGMGEKSRCMMSNSFQRDNLSSHVPDAKSFVHSNKAPLLQSPLVAALSVPHPCVATGHSQYLNSPLWNSGTLLPNSLMCGPLENGKLQEDKYSQPELKFHDSFTAMENSEQRTSSKLSLKGNNKVNHNDSVNVSNRNIFSEARRDALPAGHISYPERKSGVHECVENLPSCFADNANFNTDIPPQGDAPISHSSGLNGPVICGNNHLLEVDHRVTSLEEPSSTSREHTPSSFHLNPSKISRVSDGATSKYVDVPFCADKSLNESRPNSESGASCMEEMQGGAGLHSLKCLKCDLTADFECHLENLDFGKRCQESIVQGSIPPYPVVAPYMQDYYVPDGLGRPFPGNANMFPYVHGGYRVPPGHPFLPVGYRNANPLLLPFGMEESPKPRSGTGTYFPNTNLRSYKERCSNRGRTQGPPGQELNHHVGNQMHRSRSNGRNKTSFQNFQRQTGHKSIDREGDISHIWKNPDQVLDPMVGLMGPDLHSNTIGNGKVPISPNANPSRPVTMMQPYSNGSDFPPKQLKFGSFGPVQVDLINTTVKSEDDRHLDSDNLDGQLLKSCSEAANASSDRILQKEGALLNHERKQSWSSLLKDAEFPPLSESQHGRSSTNAGRNHNSNNRGSHWQASMTTS